MTNTFKCESCGATDAYVQKDVPKRLFLGILIVCLGVSFYLLSRNWVLGFGALVALALLDFILYKTLPNVAVCYGCGMFLRDIANSKGLKPFDPHVGEHYRTIR